MLDASSFDDFAKRHNGGNDESPTGGSQLSRALKQGISESPEKLSAYLESIGIPVRSIKLANNGSHVLTLNGCPMNPEHGHGTDTAVVLHKNGRIGFECKHNGCAEFKWTDVRSKIDPQYKNRSATPGVRAGSIEEVKIGDRAPGEDKIVLSPSDPLPSARVFLRERFTADEVSILRFYAGVCFVWRSNRYTPLPEDELRASIYEFTEHCVRQKPTRDGELVFVPFQPTQSKVSNLIDAIKGASLLSADKVPPYWLCDGASLPPPSELLPFKSGILHIPTRSILPPKPCLFCTWALEFDYDPKAGQPQKWLEFLEQLWPDDPESIATLQEWFGYCLTGDTSLQKMLLVVGPKRSGKGTIGRVLAALVGDGNVAGPTTTSLATQFGLQALIGKTLAIVSDARFAGTPESSIVLERLLCISGEDRLNIPRKFHGDVTMQLSTRFMFLTNELPRIADSSGALAGRFVVLILRNSYFGKEDTELFCKLQKELPSILLWALEGLRRLKSRGRFAVPESSRDAIQELGELSSPITAFVNDQCLVGPRLQANIDDLFAAWKGWCSERGRDRPGTRQTFGRDLLAAVPGIKRIRPRDGEERHRGYSGIGLRFEGGPPGPHGSATPPFEGSDSCEFQGQPHGSSENPDSIEKVADHRGPSTETSRSVDFPRPGDPDTEGIDEFRTGPSVLEDFEAAKRRVGIDPERARAREVVK